MISLKHALAALPLSLALMVSTTAGLAHAQVTTTGVPTLAVQLLSTGLTQNATAGTQNATFAVVRLDTTFSGDDVRISSLPLILNTGGNATGASLQSCNLYNAANMSTSLNSNNIPSFNTGLNNVALNSPLVLPRGTVTTLNLVCNLASNAVNGGTYSFSLNTQNVIATGVMTGLPAVVTIGSSAIGNGTGGTIFYPTVPNTGAGGEATRNIAIILGSLVVAALGFAVSRRYAR